MIFNNNKYTACYKRIIANAALRSLTKDVYTEKHHIIPKSLGGSNSKSNLVVLTAREHFVCHLLLPKMTEGPDKVKMVYAAWLMCCKNKRTPRDYIVNSTMYASVKKQRVAIQRTIRGPAHPNFGKKTGRTADVFTPTWRANISAAKKGKPTWNKGVARPQSVKDAISNSSKGKIPWNKGIPTSSSTAQKIKEANTGKRWVYNNMLNERKMVSPTDFSLYIAKGWYAGLGKF